MATLEEVVVGFFSCVLIIQNVLLFLAQLLLLYCLLSTKNVYHDHTRMLLASMISAYAAGNVTTTVGASAHLHQVIHSVSIESTTSACRTFGVLFNFAVVLTLFGLFCEHTLAYLARKYGYNDEGMPLIFFLVILCLWGIAVGATLPLAVDQASVFALHVISFGIAVASTILFHLITWWSLRQVNKDLTNAEEQMDFQTAAQRRLDIVNTKSIRRSFTWISVFFMIGAAMLALAELVKGDQARTVANFFAVFFNSCGAGAVVYTLMKEHSSLRAKAKELLERLFCRRNEVEAETPSSENNAPATAPRSSRTLSRF